MAKKLSVLKPLRLRIFKFFISFSYYNVEDTVTNFEKDIFENNFSLTNKKNVKKQLRNFQY